MCCTVNPYHRTCGTHDDGAVAVDGLNVVGALADLPVAQRVVRASESAACMWQVAVCRHQIDQSTYGSSTTNCRLDT